MKSHILLLALLVPLLGCTSSRPVAADVPSREERAGSVESFPLVEIRRGLFGSTEARAEGIVEANPQYLIWSAGGRDVLALRSEVVVEGWLHCVEREAADNLCLELGLRTLTGDRYFFRDRDWRAGGNRQVVALYDYLQTYYPAARFEHRTVKKLR